MKRARTYEELDDELLEETESSWERLTILLP